MAEEENILELSPEKTLTFKWNKMNDVPLAVLTASNKSSNSYIAYKVKTTAPKRYVVRPPQGCIEPGQEASIKLTMVQKDAEALWRETADDKARGGGDSKCDDKFLVQTTIVNAAYFKAELADKDDKAISAPLQQLWKQLADEDKKSDKKSIKSNKLMTTFSFPENMSTALPVSASNFKSSNHPEDAVIPPNLTASPIKSSPHGSAEGLFAELSALRKKYDDLVAYTVVLTGERDYLQQEGEEKSAALRKAEAEASSRGNGQGNSSESDSNTISKSVETSGFAFIHLIAVALIAFIIGRLIA